MKVRNDYNLYSYKSVPNLNNQSFKAASDITLKYIYENRLRLLPARMRKLTGILVSKKIEKPLRDLHLQTYAKLFDCESLEKAKNLYPEFREVLQANAVIKKNSPNIKKITQIIPLEDLTLHILKERWGNLKTLDEIAQELGLKNRSALAWTMEKIQMPDLGKNYQALLKASDERLNAIVSQKVKSFNQAHPERMLIHNRMLAQRPEVIQMNKELADEMWERMPELKAEMSYFRRDNPDIKREDFYAAFWEAYPQYKKLMSQVRLEIAEARRSSKRQ